MMRKRLVLTRLKSLEDRTLGALHVYNDLTEQARFNTLELAWHDNARRISCIPTGSYKIQGETHPKFGRCFRIKHVDGRSGVLLHRGNYPKDTQGCILIGMRLVDLDEDGLFEVGQSIQAMDYLFQLVIEESDLIITEAYQEPD